MRTYWGVTEQQAADHPSYARLIAGAPHAAAHGVPPEQLAAFFASRVEAVRTAEPELRDAKMPDDQRICVHTNRGAAALSACAARYFYGIRFS